MEEYGTLKVYMVVCFKSISGKDVMRNVQLYTDTCTLSQAKGYFVYLKGMQAEIDRAAVHYSWTCHV